LMKTSELIHEQLVEVRGESRCELAV